MTKHAKASCEDVMNSFAMDFDLGGDVLKQYLAEYPQYAADLVDLARELSRQIDEELPLNSQELAVVNAKMTRLREPSVTVEILQSTSPKTFTEAAKALGLPLQVGVAIRERRIEVETLSNRFLESLAKALKAPVSIVQSFLLLPAQVSALRANKSVHKPFPAEKVPLERILSEAGMDDKSISKVLQKDE